MNRLPNISSYARMSRPILLFSRRKLDGSFCQLQHYKQHLSYLSVCQNGHTLQSQNLLPSKNSFHLLLPNAFSGPHTRHLGARKFGLCSCFQKSSNLISKVEKETLDPDYSEKESLSLIAEMFLGEDGTKLAKEINGSYEENKPASDLDQMFVELETEPDIDDIPEDVTALQFIERQEHNFEETDTDSDSEHVEVVDLDVNSMKTSGDSESPATDVPCSGCGAYFHCNDPSRSGYISPKRMAKIRYSQLWQHTCQRCSAMRTQKKCLETNVTAEEYLEVIKQVKDIHALVLVVIDLTDLPHSIFPNLAEIIGKNRPIYIIGNKVDLLPNDSRNYLERVKEHLKRMVEDAGLTSDNYVNHYALVSSKTGYGMEQLITKIFDSWGRKGHVFILGCTNVGKSSLFNTLLRSDFCNSRATDMINRATTSVWPGTTLNLLKFPILDPAPWRLAKRRERLKELRIFLQEDKEIRRSKIKKSKTKAARKIAVLRATVEQTLFDNNPNMDTNDGEYMSVSYTYNSAGQYEGKTGTESRQQELGINQFRLSRYKDSRWCYDTPGAVNPNQIINRLNQRELEALISDLPIMPRTFVVKPGHVIFVSGLGRIDYVKGPMTAYFTVFTKSQIPVHVIPEEESETFYRENIGTEILGVPLGDAARLDKLPPLLGQDFHLCGIHWKESVADITLSSLGWVSVTTGSLMNIHVRGYTPGGIGCILRESLFPLAVNLKGKRIRGTPQYMNIKPNF